MSLVHLSDLDDPCPDVHELFRNFDTQYFDGVLCSSAVSVEWSKRMTLCAGLCSYSRRTRHCVIRLSEALLRFRPRKDLVETLLHEMIHAYLFITGKEDSREGHGPSFISHMERINASANVNVTVFHSFHDEVDAHRIHVWKCDGPCQSRRPFFGILKRAINRAPGPNDPIRGRCKKTRR